MRLMTICNGQKRTISTSSRLGLLQMVSELDIEWCASEDVGPSRGVDYEISHQLERGRNIPYKGVKPLPSSCVLLVGVSDLH